MRENILIKHLNNIILENSKIKDAFIMGVDGLLIAAIDNNEDRQRIAARMAGVLATSRRIEDRMPYATSVIIKKKNIVAIPMSEKFVMIIVGTKSLNLMSILRLVNKNKENIISVIEKNEFSDIFSYNPVEVKGLD
ncbi:MAG TPA: hypothetical protein PLP47_03125 [Methanofastidiosum sp.]|nr:hypothetical protein [Methanofastidiosum sp.]HRZ19366.1 hypothetical protein [Methanofastidiosum sp.]